MQIDTDATISIVGDALGAELSDLLQRAFDTPLSVLDGRTGEMLQLDTGQPVRDWTMRSELCRQVARRGRPEFLDDEDPFLVLAVPLTLADESSRVVVAPFVTRPVADDEDLSRPAEMLGMSPEEAVSWASVQRPWSADALLRVADLVRLQSGSLERVKELEEEAASLSVHLASTYEEISLLYRLTQNLKISQSDADLGRIALEWMFEVLPAKGLALQLVPVGRQAGALRRETRAEPVLLTFGECPLDNVQFTSVIEHLDARAANRPVVVNRSITGRADWPQPDVRQFVVASLAEGDNLFGWLAVMNHVRDAEFGTVEANLLSSVAAILGIHSGNIELYRQQSELMAGIIRALTSAIDAKDPYTCGHSDRVARVAVRLAEEIGCDAATIDTMYLSGLLHDIGKIGVEDSVLRKPGKLSDEEYEHIKRHVTIGHKILQDLGKLDEVLPVILHHHESWDGGGYPEQLTSETIPLTARIVAVADAFDAMSSNRPYRKGMPDEKIDQIFRDGAGKQWDPRVVEAFFLAREDIRQIVTEEHETDQVPQMTQGGCCE
ncbi:MAG: HD-GYP domain-containing protein [Pirellulales bacterium]|nr:HD-GYP domain-containing protein [Pirellulales bacterium]